MPPFIQSSICQQWYDAFPVDFCPLFSYMHDVRVCVYFHFYAAVHMFHCRDTNFSLHQKQHLNEWKAFSLVIVLCSSHLIICSHRSVIHHDMAFPVESLRRHTGQLSSSLHHQVLEAQVFPSKLLQTLILIQIQIPQVCFVLLWVPYLQNFVLNHWSKVDLWGGSRNHRRGMDLLFLFTETWNELRRKKYKKKTE